MNPAWNQYLADTTAWAVDAARSTPAPLMLTDHAILERRFWWLLDTFQIIRESIPPETTRDDLIGFRVGLALLENTVLDVIPLTDDAHHRMQAASFSITAFRHDAAAQAGWSDDDLEMLDDPEAPGALERLTWKLNALEPFQRGVLIAANAALTMICELAAVPGCDLDALEFSVRGVVETLENSTVRVEPSAVIA